MSVKGTLITGGIIAGLGWAAWRFESDETRKALWAGGPAGNRVALPTVEVEGHNYLFVPQLKTGSNVPQVGDNGELTAEYLNRLRIAKPKDFQTDSEGKIQGKLWDASIANIGYKKTNNVDDLASVTGLETKTQLMAKIDERLEQVKGNWRTMENMSAPRVAVQMLGNDTHIEKAQQRLDESNKQSANTSGIPDWLIRFGLPIGGLVTMAITNFSSTGLLLGGAMMAGGLLKDTIANAFAKKDTPAATNTPTAKQPEAGGAAATVQTPAQDHNLVPPLPTPPVAQGASASLPR